MNAHDLITIGVGNLRRTKLRTSLTMSGVVIAIGAFVAMLSFGAGNQRVVNKQFEDMGLLTTVIVYPPEKKEDDDSSRVVLDGEAVQELATLPGVRLAYPYDDFDVTVTAGDSVLTTRAQALPPEAFETKLFSRTLAGDLLAPDDSTGALVMEELLEELGYESPDSLLGKTLRLSVRSVSPDSGFARLLRRVNGETRIILPELGPDTIRTVEDGQELLRRAASEAVRRFLDGYLHAQTEVADTLTVRGVIRRGGRRAPVRPLVIPLRTARRFDAAGPGGDAVDILPAILEGTLFTGAPAAGSKSFTQITLDLAPWASHAALTDSVEARGYRSFSYAAEFAEIGRFLLFFNLGLGAIGVVALATAALGIVNTMLMSVSERRREIGILRSLGAEAFDIRMLFLVESGLIGAIGSALGILLGWGVARVGSRVAREIMIRQDVEPFDLFATPPWLVLTALLFGIFVSVVAGALPAARASREDPVQALRYE